MNVLGDLVARDRRSDRPALRIDARDRTRSYRDVCTTAWKSGHALGHLGVHAGSRVAIAPDPAPQQILTLLGAACLGARVAFDPTADARAAVVPADREADLDDRPDRKVVVYGDAPTGAAATHWEGVVWSENPAVPPGEVSPDDPALDDGDRSFTHRDVLSRAERVVADAGLGPEATVALRASLADPRAVVAGVVAPLLAGGTVVLPGAGTATDVAVGDGGSAARRVDLDAV